MIHGCKLALALLFFFFFKCVEAKTTLVHNQQQLTDALAKVVPGDTILLSNGEWKNVKLVIKANGTAANPIVIKAETDGQTIITGSSNVKIGGAYLIIRGLHFTNGSSPTNNVIEFRTSNDLLANNCRLTNCVIENFSKADRFDTDSWIVLWGKNNRIDHCNIGDKLNGGTTLIINLDDERSQNNFHSIDSNYFDGHSRLGSNGGETIRVGISRYSLTSSQTQIHHNLFYHCSGEVEIISVKSCDNFISRNTFYECEGGLVLRHGARNIVEGNIFVGNNKPYTGGIRVINPGHKIYNNLFIDLAGERFRSAFSVLNGVPNSALNRYFQVKDADIHNNTFINSKNIVFGAGKDAERSLAPESVKFHNNYIQSAGKSLFADENKNGGIRFSDNLFTGSAKAETGFRNYQPVKYFDKDFRGNHFHIPVIKGTGAAVDSLDWMYDQTGAEWMTATDSSKMPAKVFYLSSADSKNFQKIISSATNGDIIELSDNGIYELSNSILINKQITIRSTSKTAKPELVNVSEKSLSTFFQVENGGNLIVDGLKFNSAYKSFGDVQSAISTTTKPMNHHYSLKVNNCVFYNFNENNYSCIKGTKSTYADEVIIQNSIFRNNSGSSIDFSAEKDDKGIYNVENLLIYNCVFANNLNTAVNVYRGGNDESTTGPTVTIDHCTFNEVNNMEQGCVIKLLGVQTASITNSIFNKSGAGGRVIWFEEMSWDNLKVDYCNLYQSGRVGSFYNKVLGTHVYKLQPQFINAPAYNYNLKPASELTNKDSKGKNLGATL